jgi:hypothetical protein
MRLLRAIAGAAFMTAILTAGGASAFETTTIGGTNPDGSAKFQDPDEQQPSSLLGNFQVQQGTSQQGGTNPFFGFSGSQSSSSEPNTPFNDPTLRTRN